MSSLDAFRPATRAWFHDAFERPTRVQLEGWAAIARGEHSLLLAPTGSGKTLAAFLWAIDRVQALPDDAPAGVRVVYVSPLKALVYDVERNLRGPLAGIRRVAELHGEPVRPVRIAVRTGDTSARDRQVQGRDPAEILVTTPESLYLVLASRQRDTLRHVETVIVDEIHAMAPTKRGVHLSLTLERLAALCERDPQRIGLSATQRPLSVVARFLGGDRPVAIVDAAEPPRLDLEIVVPVEDLEHPPPPVPAPPPTRPPGVPMSYASPDRGEQFGVWPAITPRLLDLVRAHRTTLIFCNSRRLCERLTQRLNDLAGEEVARAHHGSISHGQRAEIEEALKQGRLPAIVATSSLELGIDMGTVDLVLQIESPGSVARGIQRVGRAGHQVGAVSVGRIFPKFRGDLLEAAVVAREMEAGRVEEIRLQKNCLDVLAQHLAAMVAMDEWTAAGALALARRAAPFAELADSAFAATLDMLAGRYPSDDFAELAPRISWDRATDALTARKGTAMLVRTNAGTIPDRGTYGVFLAPEGPRLGELDEEMVHESRKGDVFLLGASTWRVVDITRDRVLVVPAPGEPARMPFWRGAGPGRPVELGRTLGAFVRELGEQSDDEALPWLSEHTRLDPLAARNLLAYVRDQRAATGALPSDRTVVVERFRDELGDWRVCLLSPLGARVHAPWAMVLQARLANDRGFDVQAMWTDDGIALRLADGGEELPVAWLFPEPEEVEEALLAQLRESSVFASHFRENAARALLLPRRKAGARTPLWAQRLRSQNLLAVASRFPSFPIVLETYRECLQDVFDLPSLQELLSGVRSRAIRVVDVETDRPSPFARSLAFAWVSSFLYDADAPLAERKAMALTLDRELLRELLGQDDLRDLVDPDAIAVIEEELQHLAPDRRARDADQLHDLLRRLGDLTVDEIVSRTTEDPRPWLERLDRERRAVAVRIARETRWIAAQEAGRYRDALGVLAPPGLPREYLEPAVEPLEQLLARYARTRGPFTTSSVAARYGLLPAQAEVVLRALEARGDVVHGALGARSDREWVHAEVLRRIRRASLARWRQEVEAVDTAVLSRFTLAWHGVGGRRGGPGRLEEVLAQLEGLPVSFQELEDSLLPDRLGDYRPAMLDDLGARGVICWIGRGALGPSDGRVVLVRRERTPLWVSAPEPWEPPTPLHQALLAHLERRGASFFVELQVAAGGAGLDDVLEALWDLVWAGLVTNDTFGPLRALGTGRTSKARIARATGGRWSTVASLLHGEVNPTAQAHARTQALVDRHGVLTREAVAAEELPGGFSAAYPLLRAMEEAGKLRRGYFVDGLGGLQFASPGAVDRLRSHRDEDGRALVISAVDPACVWGSVAAWPQTATDAARPRRVPGARVVLVDGIPALFVDKGGHSLVRFASVVGGPEADERLARAVGALGDHVRRRGSHALLVQRIDGAPIDDGPAADALTRVGFARDYKGLRLAAI